MKKYNIGLGILDTCFDFQELVIKANNKNDAVREFFNQIIYEIKNLDCSKIAENDDGWIHEEQLYCRPVRGDEVTFYEDREEQ